MEQKVFDKIWFEKHQSKLLWLANSWLGKHIFKFEKMGHFLDPKKKIVKITPCSVAQFNRFIGKEAEFTEHFFTRNEYARKLYFYLYPLWLTMHIWDWFVADHFQLAPQLSFGFSTLTKSPVAGANSPCDGDCYMQGAGGGAYSTAHNASSSTSATATGTNLYIQNYYSSGGGGVYILSRGFVLFDTSSLTSGATISGAVMSLWAVYRTEANAGQAVIHIVASTPANTNNIVADDYDQTGSTSFASSAVTTAQYNNFTLNASGITNVSKTGISKFGIRLDGDLNSSTPTGANEVDIRAADYTTPGQEPYLVVTYTSTIGIQLNIADSWKQATAVKVNIGDAWKPVTKAQINIGDIWKSIF